MDREVENMRLPVIGMTKLINEAKTIIDKRDLYALAKTTNTKFGLITTVLAKQTASIKAVETAAKKQQVNSATKEAGSIAQITNSLNSITISFAAVNKMIGMLAHIKIQQPSGQQIQPTPSKPSAVPEAPGPTQSDMFGSFKSLFTNPAVVAALSGIVYTILPKETQDLVKSFLTGFAGGFNEKMAENEEQGFGSFNTAIKASGIALATFFGIKMIMSIGSAIGTVMNVVKSISIKGLGGAKTIAVVGAAAVGGAAMYMSGKKRDEEKAQEAGQRPEYDGAKPETKPTAAGTGGGAVAATTSSAASSDRNGTTNIAGAGGKAPDIKSVMTVQPGVETEGINPALKERLSLMAAEYKEKTGKKMILTSGYRDSAKQAELFARIGRPNAAPPGKSLHEKGLAIDMNSADANQAVALGLFDKYGFKRPVAGEAWHVEPIETRGGPQFADNPSAPGKPVAVATSNGKAQVAGSGKPMPESQVAAVAQPPQKDVGAIVNQVSADVNNGDRPNLKKQLLTKVNNSTNDNTADGGMEHFGPIPSPVANRGAAGARTKFLTAYV